MYIVVDVGATKMRFARVRDLEGFEDPVIVHTPHEYDDVIKLFASTLHDVAQGEPIEAVAAGKPMWKKWPTFIDDAKAAVDAPLYFENDAAMVGLGEAVFGAGKGAEICVYITISTGVNGVRIVDGKIDVSRQGFEIGAQFLSMGEDAKTLEELVSGRAIAKRFNVESPKELGKETPLWDELADILAYGVHNTILHWSPDRVVIGGSMMNEIGIPVPRVKQRAAELMERTKKFPTVPEIVHSSLKDFGGLWGGVARLKKLD